MELKLLALSSNVEEEAILKRNEVLKVTIRSFDELIRCVAMEIEAKRQELEVIESLRPLLQGTTNNLD